MADIVLHFTNRNAEVTTALVRTPVIIRFRDGIRKMKVVVRPDSNVKAIHLNAGPIAGAIAARPPGLVEEPDDDVIAPVLAVAVGGTESTRLAAASSPPPPPGRGPGVCYEVEGQVFCW